MSAMGWKADLDLRLGRAFRMAPGSLRNKQNEQDYRSSQHGSCQGSTKFESTLRNRLVQKVADRSS